LAAHQLRSKPDSALEIDLTVCPMVVEELALAPERERTGPLILNSKTGMPNKPRFEDVWA
jgi:hypothetical protein